MTEFETLLLQKMDGMWADIAEVRAELHETKAELQADIAEVRTELHETKAELQAGIAEVRTELHETKAELQAGIDGVRTELHETQAELQAGIDEVRTGLRDLNLRIENEFVPMIMTIGEGHDFLNHRLDEALLDKPTREHNELEILNLKMEVRDIKMHLCIV